MLPRPVTVTTTGFRFGLKTSTAHPILPPIPVFSCSHQSRTLWAVWAEDHLCCDRTCRSRYRLAQPILQRQRPRYLDIGKECLWEKRCTCRGELFRIVWLDKRSIARLCEGNQRGLTQCLSKYFNSCTFFFLWGGGVYPKRRKREQKQKDYTVPPYLLHLLWASSLLAEIRIVAIWSKNIS